MARKTKNEKMKIRARRMAEIIQPTSPLPSPTFTFVKREFSDSRHSLSTVGSTAKQQDKTGQITFLASTSGDIVKTFLLASVIFAIELVLYFAWK